ncbi:hypothetical protein HGRIS_005189 [Hohenbuehelia grisea]|uniref:Myosin-binding domain-containing protein n=1 Tax=Hohenbuehelia grisea TaxID=104357 RepID=A0ABR3JE77_9AGAR
MSWMWWLALVFFGTGYYTLSALALGCALVSVNLDTSTKNSLTPLLQVLDELISAGDIWDSVVHDAITALEREEHSIVFGSTSPSPSSSSLRISLNSTLHVTQSQCDNIRQLLSALTSPSELPQLSEMYAPPSPKKSTHDLSDPHTPRRLSLTSPRQRASSLRTDPGVKRSSWNGAYTSATIAGSPTMRVLSRREKRRSDLSSLLQASSPTKSLSAPTTPLDTPVLSNVKEEDFSGEGLPSESSSPPSFGAGALELRRKRRSVGLDSLGLRLSGSGFFRTPRSPPATISSSSRFTALQTTRHPLSLSALNLALQGALSSKRYACAHLLALRFLDEDDEGYWEDVRSVMSLLTTTFVDAASRLTEALEEVEKSRIQDETPTPEAQSRRTSLASASAMGVKNASYLDEQVLKENLAESLRRSIREDNSLDGSPHAKAHGSPVSFAPTPSHVARFAAHVEAISSALADARENLAECVASLREEPDQGRQPLSSPTSSNDVPPPAPPALQAYERLRRELGLALRECERGRERLLDIVAPRSNEDAERNEYDDMPALGPDHGSDSDKADSSLLLDYDGDRDRPVSFALVLPDAPEGTHAGEEDDATAHLLQSASSSYLPPIGAEQVFESDSVAVGLFNRERSKLSREERIKLAKVKRESTPLPHSHFDDVGATGSGVHERWGPGGEVVQELKDVIWKVGERRRRMTMEAENIIPGPDDAQARSDQPS